MTLPGVQWDFCVERYLKGEHRSVNFLCSLQQLIHLRFILFGGSFSLSAVMKRKWK